MKILATDKKEFEMLEKFTKDNKLNEDTVELVSYNKLIDRIEVSAFRQYKDDLVIFLPKKANFWKVWTTVVSEDLETNSKVYKFHIACEGVTYLYTNSYPFFSLELYEEPK